MLAGCLAQHTCQFVGLRIQIKILKSILPTGLAHRATLLCVGYPAALLLTGTVTTADLGRWR